MRKLIALMALILIAGVCFAQEAQEVPEAAAPPQQAAAGAAPPQQEAPRAAASRDIEKIALEISLGVPFHWTNSPAPNDFAGATASHDKTVTANTALGFALLFNFSNSFGFTVDTDFFFGGDVLGQSGPSSASNSIFGANAFVGPVFYLHNSGPLRIPFAVGVHTYYWSSDVWTPSLDSGSWVKHRDLQLGLGFYLGFQFHINDSIYIFNRTNIAAHVFRYQNMKVGDGTDVESFMDMTYNSVSWGVKPTLGVGIKY